MVFRDSSAESEGASGCLRAQETSTKAAKTAARTLLRVNQKPLLQYILARDYRTTVGVVRPAGTGVARYSAGSACTTSPCDATSNVTMNGSLTKSLATPSNSTPVPGRSGFANGMSSRSVASGVMGSVNPRTSSFGVLEIKVPFSLDTPTAPPGTSAPFMLAAK